MIWVAIALSLLMFLAFYSFQRLSVVEDRVDSLESLVNSLERRIDDWRQPVDDLQIQSHVARRKIELLEIEVESIDRDDIP